MRKDQVFRPGWRGARRIVHVNPGVRMAQLRNRREAESCAPPPEWLAANRLRAERHEEIAEAVRHLYG